jgi:hypothetical protein
MDHQTVAEILGDVTAKACDRRRRSTLVLRGDLPPVFGIEMSRNLGRANQIREQNCKMAAFAVKRVSASAWPSGDPNLNAGLTGRRWQLGDAAGL